MVSLCRAVNLNQTLAHDKVVAQGYMATLVGLEPPTSVSGVPDHNHLGPWHFPKCFKP